MLSFVLGAFLLISGSLLFTNGLEWCGKLFKLSGASIGSLFAAIGTALPETVVPLFAFFHALKNPQVGDVGIGNMAGAVFMLVTLGFGLGGVSVSFNKNLPRKINNKNDWVHKFTIVSFMILLLSSCVAVFFGIRAVEIAAAVFNISYYFFYARVLFKSNVALEETPNRLYLWKTPTRTASILQTSIGLIMILWGAEAFVKGIMFVSQALHVPPLLIALFIAPFATEAPEIVNAVVWFFQGKYTYAVGVLLGATVFQAAFPFSVALLFHQLSFTGDRVLVLVLLGVSALIEACLFLKLSSDFRRKDLLLCGVAYLITLGGVWLWLY